jgi:hypothetical protein
MNFTDLINENDDENDNELKPIVEEPLEDLQSPNVKRKL